MSWVISCGKSFHVYEAFFFYRKISQVYGAFFYRKISMFMRHFSTEKSPCLWGIFLKKNLHVYEAFLYIFLMCVFQMTWVLFSLFSSSHFSTSFVVVVVVVVFNVYSFLLYDNWIYYSRIYLNLLPLLNTDDDISRDRLSESLQSRWVCSIVHSVDYVYAVIFNLANANEIIFNILDNIVCDEYEANISFSFSFVFCIRK